MDRTKLTFLHTIVLLMLLLSWQGISAYSSDIRYFFGSPVLVLEAFFSKPRELVMDTTITGLEAIIGLVLGVSVGSFLGFILLFTDRIAVLARPYIIAFGSVPVFALAPILIIWFGIGYPMKIAGAFLATVLVALSQAYEGGRNIDPHLISWFNMYSESKRSVFWKLIVPSSLSWIFVSLKLNVGFALLGAFLGEFIASDSGLGHEILSAGALYQFPRVFAAAICIIFLALGLNTVVSILERSRHMIIEVLTVPKILRDSRKKSLKP